MDGTLYVNFGQDGETITLALADGTPVGTPNPPGTVIAAGTYAVVIDNPYRDDLSIIHMFDLTGPGVLILTDLNAGEEQQAVYPAVFQPSATYTWQDDRNPSLHGVFRTTATVTATSPAQPTPAPAPAAKGTTIANSGVTKQTSAAHLAFRGTLAGTVAANGVVALTKNGKAVEKAPLPAGRYTLVVSDNDANAGLTLAGVKRAAVAATSASFVGRRVVNLTLTSGQWSYYGRGPKHYFIAVA
jgi:hypothetical protein